MTEHDETQQKSSGLEGCKKNPRLRAMLRCLQDELAQLPDTKPRKDFQSGLEEAAKEYDAFPDLVKAYTEGYRQMTCGKISEAGCQYNEIKSLVEDEPSNETKALIEEMRQEGYEGKLEQYKKDAETAREAHEKLQGDLERARLTEARAKVDYDRAKDLLKRVEGWFTALAELHKSALEYAAAGRHNATYAARLEAEDLHEQIDKITSRDTPDDFRRQLTGALRTLVKSRCDVYVSHEASVQAEQAAKTTKERLDAFAKSRRDDFVREAEEVVDQDAA